MEAVTSCDLSRLEAFIVNCEPNQLLLVAETLGRLVNSQELRITARKFTWKQRGIARWGVNWLGCGAAEGKSNAAGVKRQAQVSQ